MNKKLKLLDLFSGIGGFSLGLERSGAFETVAFCEIEPYPRAVLAKHWPGIPCYDDIRTLTAERLAADGITVDAICGGFPCQDISDAGCRIGIEGSRSGLWREYARLIGELRPIYVIVENTEALIQRGLGAVLADLAAIGYDAEWHCIPAAAIGADHLRDRIWIIAYPNRARDFPPEQFRWEQFAQEVGQNAPQNDANDNETRLSGWMPSRKIREDAAIISTGLGLALSAAPAFPGLDWAGSPVLDRSEDGIPNRVDRMHAIGNAVVPQIPEIIGKCINMHMKGDEI